MKPVIFLNSHPIQYFSPLYQQITSTTNIQLKVLYCSDESIKGKMDKGFGKEIKWDIPLLDGYQSHFIKNISWKASIHKGFWGLINPGIIPLLYREPKSLVIVHGWAYCTNILTIVFGRIFGHTVCLRAETPLNQELKKNKLTRFFKNIYLRLLFLFIDRFLYIGVQNKLFYRSLGIKEKKLVFAPYCVDNERFRNILYSNGKEETKKILKIDEEKQIILYSGKYIDKKRPMDLLMAFNELNDPGVLLIFVGDGALKPQMLEYISSHNLQNKVLLTGFINQSEIPLYYRVADIFVMCSGLGETWGLSVNEAMNFGLPILVSDTCGSAYDLVDKEETGEIFETGNIFQLTSLLKKHLHLTTDLKKKMSDAAFKKIDAYSYDVLIRAIENISA